MSSPLFPEPENRTSIRCLVIQLARLGDSIQSLMALRAAKQLYPELEISIIVRARFSAAVKRVPWIHKVYILETAEIIGSFLDSDESENYLLDKIQDWINSIISEKWDYLVNWSFTETSSFLTALVPALVKLGYSRRRIDCSINAVDGWSQFVFGVVNNKVYQNIHFTDILTTQLLTSLQIQLGDPRTDGNSPVTSKSFFLLPVLETQLEGLFSDYSRRWISIQLGSSQVENRWNTESFVEIIQLFLNTQPKVGIFLLGGESDLTEAETIIAKLKTKLKKEITSDKKSLICLVGKTDFSLWTSIIGRSQWLISGDTAAIHLASVLGTRVLHLSIGPSKFTETGPYGNGHYVIRTSEAEPKEAKSHPKQAHRPISAKSIYHLWAYAVQEWSSKPTQTLEEYFQKHSLETELKSQLIYRSRIRSATDGGGVVYESAYQKPIQIKEWSAQVMGHVARSWYCGWLPPLGLEMKRSTIPPELIIELRKLAQANTVLIKILNQCIELTRKFKQKLTSMRSRSVMPLKEKQSLEEILEELKELDQLMDRLGSMHPPIQAFSQMRQVLLHHLKHLNNKQENSLGEEALNSYLQIQDGVELFQKWINYTLELVKPVAIQNKSEKESRLRALPSLKEW